MNICVDGAAHRANTGIERVVFIDCSITNDEINKSLISERLLVGGVCNANISAVGDARDKLNLF